MDDEKKIFEFDKTDIDEIKNDIIFPYLKGESFYFDGYFLSGNDVKRILVKETKIKIGDLTSARNDRVPAGVLIFYTPSSVFMGDFGTNDITKKIISESKLEIGAVTSTEKTSNGGGMSNANDGDKSKVFVVHGHDVSAKSEVARFIERIGFEAIILHEQANEGKTIIEKIERYSDVGFGIVLYTPCDLGASSKDKGNMNFRARQNVVFEHGFLIGKIGRSNVCALVKGDIEKPNDISGVVYVDFGEGEAWKYQLAKEMKKSGYDVDLNKI
ncbi:TIR domain-containing protein [Thalassospira sp. MCCC 1A01428]|uniref:TIR domain-containing protein n=1 Tax=Thalassospira sp. MCCC 1A01428 TaxID=1470575 RepID=UPI00111C4EDE|nr:nucleotide-binding protein [Thalassospira sp. MCCC 1A01428]